MPQWSSTDYLKLGLWRGLTTAMKLVNKRDQHFTFPPKQGDALIKYSPIYRLAAPNVAWPCWSFNGQWAHVANFFFRFSRSNPRRTYKFLSNFLSKVINIFSCFDTKYGGDIFFPNPSGQLSRSFDGALHQYHHHFSHMTSLLNTLLSIIIK